MACAHEADRKPEAALLSHRLYGISGNTAPETVHARTFLTWADLQLNSARATPHVCSSGSGNGISSSTRCFSPCQTGLARTTDLVWVRIWISTVRRISPFRDWIALVGWIGPLGAWTSAVDRPRLGPLRLTRLRGGALVCAGTRRTFGAAQFPSV